MGALLKLNFNISKAATQTTAIIQQCKVQVSTPYLCTILLDIETLRTFRVRNYPEMQLGVLNLASVRVRVVGVSIQFKHLFITDIPQMDHGNIVG